MAISAACTTQCTASEGCIPQSELPVTGGVAVPVGERLHPALQPRALVDERGERRRRHGCGGSAGVRGCLGRGLPSIADCRSGEVVLVRRKTCMPIGEGRGRPSLGPRTRLALPYSATASFTGLLSPPVTTFLPNQASAPPPPHHVLSLRFHPRPFTDHCTPGD
jgi:hypothetical protein